MPKHRVLIVDDHDIVRQGLRFVLSDQPRFEVVGDAKDGHAACEQAAKLLPDLIVMDASMTEMNGADATRRILKILPSCRVVVLSAYREPAYVRGLFAAGARGYILKHAAMGNLLDALRVVADGGVFLDPALSSGTHPTDQVCWSGPETELSSREIEVASLGARGHSNADIGDMLGISVKTVETHKTRLMKKLGITTRTQLIQYAIYRGWLLG